MPLPEPDRPLLAAFEVRIDGTPLAPRDAAHVESLSVDQETGAPGMFALRFMGTHELGTALPWVDDDRFAIGKAVELKLGYADALKSVIVGEIVGLEPEYRPDQRPSLTVRGFDRLHRLSRGRKVRTFLQQKDSDVAAQIASEASLTADAADSAVTHEYLLQANQSDLQFLLGRAARINYELSVEDRTLRFRPAQHAQPAAATFKVGEDLSQLDLHLSAARLPSEVTVRGWSAKDKKEIVGQARSGDETSRMGARQVGPALVQAAFDVAVENPNWPQATQAEADQVAKALYNEAALGLVEGEAVGRGRTDVRAGSVVEIVSVGRRFSGAYYVTAVRHRYTLTGGYETSFKVRRNAS